MCIEQIRKANNAMISKTNISNYNVHRVNLLLVVQTHYCQNKECEKKDHYRLIWYFNVTKILLCLMLVILMKF